MKLKRDFPDYTRNVITLMTGTAIAQAMPIAITPILTRLYSPSEFGVYGLFISITTIISVIATGRYELAILLPRKDTDAFSLAILSCFITLFVSLLTAIFIFIFNEEIVSLLDSPDISIWLYFMPLSILLTGIYQSACYWLNRNKEYKLIAVNRVVQSSTTASSNLVLGYSGFSSSGLIVGQMIGQMVSTCLIVMRVWSKAFPENFAFKKLPIYALAKRYIKFPKIDVPSSLLNVSSHQLIHVLFNMLFNSTVAGYFYLAQRILGIPVSILSSAILSVFQQQASKDYKQGSAKIIFIKTFKQLLFISVLPAAIIYFYAVDIFVFAFGENWALAGVYAQMLAPMLFLQFISSPLSFMLYIGEKQEFNFYNQLLLFVLVVASFFVSSDAEQVVFLLSLSFSFFYMVQLFVSSKVAGVI